MNNRQMRARLDRLTRLARDRAAQKEATEGPRRAALEAADRVHQTLNRLTEAAYPLLDENLRGRLDAALDALWARAETGELSDEPNGLEDWYRALCFGDCRLPDDLSPETFAAVLATWLPPADPDDPHGHRRDRLDAVCDACGLARHLPPGRILMPGEAPPVYPCPHCGSTDWTWTSRIHEQRRPWMDLPGVVPQWRRPNQ